MINLIILLILSVVLSFLAMKITKLTKIPFLLVFVLIGFVLQFLGVNNNEVVVNSMNLYTQAVSIVIIYIMAGYAMELKKQEKITLSYGTKAFFSIWILGTILAVAIGSIFIEINTINILVITSTVAVVSCSTPVLFLSFFNVLPTKRKNTRNTTLILSGAVFEQAPAFLVIVIPLIIAMGVGSSSSSSNNIFVSIISILILLTIVLISGFIVAKIIFKLLLGKTSDWLTLAVLVVVIVLMVKLIPIFAGQYLMAGAGAGLALNNIKGYDIPSLKGKFAQISGLFAFPIMFLYLGITTPVLGILSIKTILIAIVIYLFFVVLKSIIARQILFKENATKDEVAFGISLVLLSGSTYMNMAISFQAVYIGLGFESLPTKLISVGIIIYIFSIVLSSIMVKNENFVKKLYRLK